jgi:hypothetical protein
MKLWVYFAAAMVGGSSGCSTASQDLGNNDAKKPTDDAALANNPPEAGVADGSEGGAPGNDVTGIWDLVATSPGGNVTNGVLSIARNALTVSVGNGDLDYAGSTNTVTWTMDTTTSHLDVQRTPAPLDPGILAIDVGGTSTFSTAGAPGGVTCSASLSPTSWTGSCSPGYVANWPAGAVPFPQYGVTYVATRTQALASVFGDMGGTWTARGNGPGQCTVTFEGSSFSASCANEEPWSASIQLTFSGTDTASGMTSDGIELAAHKR